MINIKNIYWMLAYAFRAIDATEIKEMSNENFDNIYDLLALMMSKEINKQIKRGLNKEYILNRELLPTVRGKIILNKFNKTFKLCCEFDEYSLDSYLNQIIKTSGYYLIKSNKLSKNILNKLKQSLIYLSSVSIIDIKSIDWSKIKYNRNNLSYEILINISYLIINGLLINTNKGNVLYKNYIDDQHLHRLYEKFILEYYRYHYRNLVIYPSPQIKWNIDNNEYIDLLPKMQTDITLKYKDKILIIDAKFYTKYYQENTLYDKKTYHSNNLYQIFTYVKNKDVLNNGKVKGLLLYAKTNEDHIKESTYNMDGNNISIGFLDLSKEFNNISDKLNKIANEFQN